MATHLILSKQNWTTPPAVNQTLTAAAGTYAFTGSNAALNIGHRTLLTTPGAYAYTGTSALTKRGRRVVAPSSSYVSAGSSVTAVKAAAFWQGLATVWPNASTTGPRIALTNEAGGTKNGVNSGKRYTGTVTPGNGSTFTDCEFTADFGIQGNSTNAFTCRYCNIIASSGSEGQGVVGRGTLEYCEISNYQDGFRPLGSGWAMRRCYLHGPWAGGADPHNDGMQCWDSGGVIEENYITWRDTSAIMVQSFTNQASNAPGNIIIRHNWLGGADIMVRIESECAGKGNRLYENVIEEGFYGYYDVSGAADADVFGNIDSVTGALIDD